MSNTFIPQNPDNKEAVSSALFDDLEANVGFIPHGYMNGPFSYYQSPFGDVEEDLFQTGSQNDSEAKKTLAQYLVPSYKRSNSDSPVPNYATYLSFTCPIDDTGYLRDGWDIRSDESRSSYSFPTWLLIMWSFHVYCTVKKRSFNNENMKVLKDLFEDSIVDGDLNSGPFDKLAENFVNVFFIRCNGNSAMPEKVRVSVISEGFKKFIHSGFSLDDLTQNEMNHRNALIKAYDRLAVSIAPALDYESDDISCTDVFSDLSDLVCGMYGFFPESTAHISRNREISFKQKYVLWGAWA